jgi:hypothetical protein
MKSREDRMKVLAMLLVATLLCATAFADVHMEFDKFKKRRIFKTDSEEMVLTKGHGMTHLIGLAFYENNAIIDHAPDELDLMFTSGADDWIYLKFRDGLTMSVIADDAHFDLPINYYDSSVLDGPVCHEAMEFTLKPDQLIAIATSRKVEFQVLNSEFKLPAQLQGDLMELCYQTKIALRPPPPPIVIPFDQTDEAKLLRQKIADADKAVSDTTNESAQAFEKSKACQAATKDVADADAARKSSEGQARLDASRAWLAAKAKLQKLRDDAVTKDPVILDAKGKADAARAEMTKAASDYAKHPSTRPAI